MTTLTFQNTAMTVINQNNQTFFTATDLGNALEYANPFQSIVKIYDRNADEFTPEMTALIEMQTNGGKQQVRIFSLRGAHLIAMFARTKVAKDFRKWVLDILDAEIAKNQTALIGTINPEQQQAIQAAVQQAHHRTGLHWQEIYRQIKAIFHVAKYDQLPANQFGNVMAYIGNLQKIEQIAPLAESNKRNPLIIIRKDSSELKLFLRLLSHTHEYSKIQDAIRNGTTDPNLLPVCQHLLYRHDNGDGFMFSFKADVQNDLNQASKLISQLV